MVDPTRDLEHDHVRFSQLVAELRAWVDRGLSPENGKKLVDVLGHLREDLFLHFAREEEGLFPYVVERLPATRAAVDKLVASHDGICGALSRMVYLVQTAKPKELDEHAATLRGLLERFEAAYQQHAREEVIFLRELGQKLTEEHRRELVDLVHGL